MNVFMTKFADRPYIKRLRVIGMMILFGLFRAFHASKSVGRQKFSVSDCVINGGMCRYNFRPLSVVFFRITSMEFFSSVAQRKPFFNFSGFFGFAINSISFIYAFFATSKKSVFGVFATIKFGQRLNRSAFRAFFHRGIICH